MIEYRSSVLTGRPIETMRGDVGDNGGVQQIVARLSSVEAVTQQGRRDLFPDGVERVNAGALLFRVGREVEGIAGARDHNPLGEGEQATGLVPLRQGKEAVVANQVEEGGFRVLGGERGKGVHGVVGQVAGPGRVDRGGLEARGVSGLGGASEPDHRETMVKGSSWPSGFKRLTACGGKEDGIKREGVGCCHGDGHVASMDGVEGAAEEGEAHGASVRLAGLVAG